MSPPKGAPEPRLIHTLREDVGQVMDDVRARGVFSTLRRTFSDLDRFYLTDHARRRIERRSAPVRMFYRIGWLIRGLLMKLTPARRVMLALAFLFFFFGNQRWDFGNVHIFFQWRFVGYILIVLVLMLELKDKLAARDELQAGRTVQLALMPQRNPDIPGWNVWMYSEPANDVGGDLVDHLAIDGTRHAVVLGDVAGKALPAALLMVKLQATIRALIPQFSTLGELGAAVNRILVRDGLPSRFATLVYMVLTPEAGDVQLLNAGHPPPLLVRDDEITELPRGSMALGIMDTATFTEQRVSLAKGDLLIAYSDGVTEAANSAGDFFGEDRLKEAVRKTLGRGAAPIGDAILSALAEFVGDAPPHDDISVVILRKT